MRLTCEITIAGVSLDPATAKAEAAKTVEIAVGIAGARLTVTGVTASLSRHYRGGSVPVEQPAAGES